MQTTSTEKFLITPFRRDGRKLIMGETRPATTEESAKTRAEAMAGRYAGVLAVAVQIDKDSGEMVDLREIARHGDVPAAHA